MSCTYTVPDYNKVYTIPTNSYCGGTPKVTTYIRKAHDEVFDIGFDWTNVVASGETISSSNWTVATGLTGGTTSISGMITKIEISGGTISYSYNVSNKIGTSGGDVFSITRTVSVMEK